MGGKIGYVGPPAGFSKVESVEQAAHLVQPALTVSEVIPASVSQSPIG
jgi:hypothetical protein